MKSLTIAIIFFTTFLSCSLTAQEEYVDYKVWATDYLTEKNLKNVTVTVFINDSLVDSYLTNRKGMVFFKLYSGNVYKIQLSKNGLVSRFCIVDFSQYTSIHQNPSSGISLALFERQPTIDYSYIENNPVTRAYYDEVEGEFIVDKVLIAKMKEEVDKVVQKK